MVSLFTLAPAYVGATWLGLNYRDSDKYKQYFLNCFGLSAASGIGAIAASLIFGDLIGAAVGLASTACLLAGYFKKLGSKDSTVINFLSTPAIIIADSVSWVAGKAKTLWKSLFSDSTAA